MLNLCRKRRSVPGVRLDLPTGAEALRNGLEKPPSLSLSESGVPAEKEERPVVLPMGTLRALRSRT